MVNNLREVVVVLVVAMVMLHCLACNVADGPVSVTVNMLLRDVTSVSDYDMVSQRR